MLDRDDALQLLEYDRWANRGSAAQLARSSAPPPEAVKLWAHIVGASELWLERVLGGDYLRVVVWPSGVVLDELARRFERVSERWHAHLARADAAELARRVAFTNSKGEPCHDRLDDIVRHLATHGAQHRAQIASELRRAGATPANLDFIVWCRERERAADTERLRARPSPPKHFVIESTYLAPLSEIDAQLAAHRAHLDTGFQRGLLLASGPQEPRTGGMILARAADRAEIEDFLARDPFAQAGLSRYRVIEFVPVKRHASTDAWWGMGQSVSR